MKKRMRMKEEGGGGRSAETLKKRKRSAAGRLSDLARIWGKCLGLQGSPEGATSAGVAAARDRVVFSRFASR
jgi:hypothetical protein